MINATVIKPKAVEIILLPAWTIVFRATFFARVMVVMLTYELTCECRKLICIAIIRSIRIEFVDSHYVYIVAFFADFAYN